MNFEFGLVGFAALICVGILLHHPSRTLGLPSLLIFMAVGLVIGNGEFGFIYDDFTLTSAIGAIALNIIVFVGGLSTSTQSIKVAYKEGGVLSSLGVVFSTVVFAGIIYVLFALPPVHCLLFGAIVSSTDAAAVFSILESKKLKLKEDTDTILEFESATNDPVALILVVLLTSLALTPDTVPSVASIGIELFLQIFVALAIAISIGKLCTHLLNSIKLEEYGLIPVFILASAVLAMYGSDLLGGNILLASYVVGVVIGNGVKRGMEVSRHFFNSLSWLAQAILFVALGLQIFPQELFKVFWQSLLPAFLLILVARPIAVQLCYLPFRKASWQKRLFISSIGLKGATPIVFALIPAAAGVENAVTMVHMVFFIVVISVFVQGGAIEVLANKLNLKEVNTPED
ncbi:potassium/proton antiporter [Vibrio mediterranei]|uniref:potassium/proton antiporter n=1 Tax=Vibrio mediterranei TaxID=689 RepID=UPI00148D6C64|nr:potassium/proton antiporter [Vibrio mediterranei]MCG9627770.1 potassium/proton antiporter [Vibrio mediterranei]NOH31365.1 potassium/proton antiporter [Vibrio mediterranei]NOI22745.1 potassium/proton antiporter [Vibrio mediterranei]